MIHVLINHSGARDQSRTHGIFFLRQMLVVVFGGFILSASSQTAIIAHKSHSGTAANFFIDPNTNFGVPPSRLIQIVRLNDTTSVEVNYNSHFGYGYDTVYKNPSYANYHLNIDSVKKVSPYLQNVEYVNFKHSPKSAKSKIPEKDSRLENSKKIETNPMEQPNPLITPTPSKKKEKKSYLLFLFGITGGGMLLIKLLGRSKSTHLSIS